jgi:hypothetical protein
MFYSVWRGWGRWANRASASKWTAGFRIEYLKRSLFLHRPPERRVLAPRPIEEEFLLICPAVLKQIEHVLLFFHINKYTHRLLAYADNRTHILEISLHNAHRFEVTV